MTVPRRVEAARLLRSLDPPAWFLGHARAVAEVAGWLALRIERAGTSIDRSLVESAALLHDVDKLLPASDPDHRLPHGEGTAAWLARRGHPELGPVVVAHPVSRLADDQEAAVLARADLETRIVAYADKRAGQRLEPMAARFEAWRRRYPPRGGSGWDEPRAARAYRHAVSLEADVCACAGVAPPAVRRLAWTTRALRSAAG